MLFVPVHFLSHAQSTARSELSIQLLLSTNPGPHNTADGVVALFGEPFSTAIGNEDSYKITNPDENLAIVCNGKLLSIDGEPAIRGSDTLQLAMWTFRQNAYYLKFSASNFSAKTKAVIKDNYLHKETIADLTAGTLVPFSITPDSASFAVSRFSVVFKTKRVMPASSIAKFGSVFKDDGSVSVFPNPAAGNEINVRMNNMKKGKYTVSLYTLAGEIAYSGFITNDSSAAAKKVVTDRRLGKGMYNLLLTFKYVTIKKSILFQ